MLPRVLLVEDDDAIREVYALKLELTGFPVAVAENGAIGLRQVQEFTPNIILLDLMMPVMGGLEFLEHLQSAGFDNQPTVIIFSNLSAADSLDSTKQLGVSDYWVKSSYTPERLTEELIKHWRGSRGAEHDTPGGVH
jgi:CheY-like chemotaxis protein